MASHRLLGLNDTEGILEEEGTEESEGLLESVGSLLGVREGEDEGEDEGEALGLGDGLCVADAPSPGPALTGEADGSLLGEELGVIEGEADGSLLGEELGVIEGSASLQAVLLAVFEQNPAIHSSIVQSIPSEHSVSFWHCDGGADGERLVVGAMLGDPEGVSLGDSMPVTSMHTSASADPPLPSQAQYLKQLSAVSPPPRLSKSPFEVEKT